MNASPTVTKHPTCAPPARYSTDCHCRSDHSRRGLQSRMRLAWLGLSEIALKSHFVPEAAINGEICPFSPAREMEQNRPKSPQQLDGWMAGWLDGRIGIPM